MATRVVVIAAVIAAATDQTISLIPGGLHQPPFWFACRSGQAYEPGLLLEMLMILKYAGMAVLVACASQTCAAEALMPGLWDVTVAIEGIEGSAVTPQMKQGVAAQKPQTQQQCLTADQLMPSPEKLEKESGGKCKATAFSLANGRMSSATICAGQGPTINSTTSGSYGPKNYAFHVVSRMVSPKGDITTRMLTTGKWLGPCTPK